MQIRALINFSIQDGMSHNVAWVLLIFAIQPTICNHQ